MGEPADNVVEFPPKDSDAVIAAERYLFEDTVRNLIAAVEQMDRGLKMLVDIATDHDTRLRALELAQRKAERRNVPAIVNAKGERVR